MKIWKRIFMTVLTVSLLLIPSFASFAAEDNAYTYKVTFSTGVQGTFLDGTDKMAVTDIPAGAKVFFTAQDVVQLDASSKYYVKGVRLSGRDNSEVEMTALTLTVSEDADYVVVYGIKGNQVSYTVNYQDENGNALAESDVFYGNVGDKPVVAYKYIDGYAPKVFGLTKTLSADASENVFTFVYGEGAVGSNTVIYEDGDTVIVYVDKEFTIISGGQGDGGGNNPGQNTEDDTNADDTTDDIGEDDNTDEVENEDSQNGETTEDGDTTDEEDGEDTSDVIVDLDEEEVPLANQEGDKAKATMAAIGSLVGVSAAALIAILVLMFKAKRQKTNEE